jgi:hypothetical protein
MKNKKCDCHRSTEVLLENLLQEIRKGAKHIMATLQDLKDAIADIQTKVDADVEQDVKVVEAINVLLAKLATLPNTQDFQEEVDAVKAASAKLSSDNAAVQTAIDAAVPPTA